MLHKQRSLLKYRIRREPLEDIEYLELILVPICKHTDEALGNQTTLCNL